MVRSAFRVGSKANVLLTFRDITESGEVIGPVDLNQAAWTVSVYRPDGTPMEDPTITPIDLTVGRVRLDLAEDVLTKGTWKVDGEFDGRIARLASWYVGD